MQAENITDLFLNLEAIVFLGKLDSVIFWLARSGFLKQELEEACALTEKIRIRLSGNRQGRTKTKRLLLLFVWAALVAGWASGFYKQQHGVYLKSEACFAFSVDFGDYTSYLDGTKIKADKRVVPLRDYELKSYEMERPGPTPGDLPANGGEGPPPLGGSSMGNQSMADIASPGMGTRSNIRSLHESFNGFASPRRNTRRSIMILSAPCLRVSSRRLSMKLASHLAVR